MENEVLIVGGGCFWCVEAIYRDLRGVLAVENGYAGGDTPNPTYREVGTGTTNHAEVVRVEFDPAQITREQLLKIFFTVHDPTTLNRQGNDVGTQYRSVIFYETDAQRSEAERVIEEVTAASIWPAPIVTTLEPLKNYARAESYHQDYYRRFETASLLDKLQMNAGYCQAVIMPKVVKFRKQYADQLKR